MGESFSPSSGSSWLVSPPEWGFHGADELVEAPAHLQDETMSRVGFQFAKHSVKMTLVKGSDFSSHRVIAVAS